MTKIVIALAVLALLFVISVNTPTGIPEKAETYELSHAIGNEVTVAGRGLNKAECEKRKTELKFVASTLRTGGTVTCLPESLLRN